MPTIKNDQKKNYLHIALRIALHDIVKEYERANGTRNSENKLFIVVSPQDDAEYIKGIQSKDAEVRRKTQREGIKSVAIALIENGKKDFAHPYLLPIVMNIVGNKAKQKFANLGWADGCLVVDGGKPFNPAKNEIAPAPEADKVEAQDEAEAPVKKSRKSKKDESSEAEQA